MYLTGSSITLDKPYSIEALIGEGGFGAVYRAKDNLSNRYAIKVVSSHKEGIPCLMEASIMATYIHPYINRSLHIEAIENTLYIVQNEAVGDLFSFLERKEITKEDTIIIFNQLLQALSFMHAENIIHGDIKTTNVLVFLEPKGEKIYKLSDFNLSINKAWKPSPYVCTDSHMPLEGWEVTWDASIDVWCLGQAIYTCLYYHSIFCHQPKNSKQKAYINALYDWEAIYYKYIGATVPKRKYYKLSYNKPQPMNELFSSSNINKLILASLHPEKSKRPSVNTLLSHNIFSGFKTVTGKTRKVIPIQNLVRIPKNIYPLPKDYVIDYMYPQETVKNLSHSSARVASFIYSRYEPYITDKKSLVLLAISIMASKITREEEINISDIDDINAILRIERDVCRKLGFILC